MNCEFKKWLMTRKEKLRVLQAVKDGKLDIEAFNNSMKTLFSV